MTHKLKLCIGLLLITVVSISALSQYTNRLFYIPSPIASEITLEYLTSNDDYALLKFTNNSKHTLTFSGDTARGVTYARSLSAPVECENSGNWFEVISAFMHYSTESYVSVKAKQSQVLSVYLRRSAASTYESCRIHLNLKYDVTGNVSVLSGRFKP
jgi:hypothetical protein